MDRKIETLRNIPIFSGLDNDELHYVQNIAIKRSYKKKAIVFLEGEEREAVFFIQSGILKAYKIDEDGNEQVISLLHDGDMFPHVGFFDASPYPATVEVVQDVELLVVLINDFEELVMQQPQIAIKVMKIMGKKILDLQQRVQDFISKDVTHRLVEVLIKLAKEQGIKNKEGISLQIPITNQDFANMVGTSRESINRILNQMKKNKLILTDRNGIFIYDLEKLQNFQ
ncbi:Crp/Fnr family transcriptional regulator [Metabacillus malikii]|uniref:CRP/FNR family transcriptional regulator n=1 Tax=Metabacillus malikii TaxID=1504265 RepID=A0ABT9ZAJ7_9BACI|nr:Crp/Fnr family transcriptional regulator [Metabacillus malikii]MDQ0229273.1 CRP/FNR family transcriptional regulator [Metabacillus malikii]